MNPTVKPIWRSITCNGLQTNNNPFALFLSIGTPHDPWTQDNVPAMLIMRCFETLTFRYHRTIAMRTTAYGDTWAVMSPAERAELPEWMRVYYAMTANLDRNIGRLLHAIDDLGLRDNTIFVFTSDHGEMFGAQGRRAKNIFYEEAVRVPFLVRWPGQIPTAHVSDACLNTPDIMPTLLSMLELPIPGEVEGRDLSNTQKYPGECHTAFIPGEAHTGDLIPLILIRKNTPFHQPADEPDAAFMQGMGCTAKWEDGYEWRALRTKRYTYAIHRPDRSEKLFDNVADPFQTRNLIDESKSTGLRDQFRIVLQQRMNAINDTFEACTWYRDNWTEDRIIRRTATST